MVLDDWSDHSLISRSRRPADSSWTFDKSNTEAILTHAKLDAGNRRNQADALPTEPSDLALYFRARYQGDS